MANLQAQDAYDDQHWIELGKRVNDPEAAALIVNFLDGYPSLRTKHSGLYLLAAEVVHRARVSALLQAMQDRKAYRFARFIGKVVALTARCVRLGFRAACAGLANIRKGGSGNGDYKRSTIVYPSGNPSKSERAWEGRKKLSNLVFLFREGACGRCGAPVGQLQERCEECGQLLKTPGAVGQTPVQA